MANPKYLEKLFQIAMRVTSSWAEEVAVELSLRPDCVTVQIIGYQSRLEGDALTELANPFSETSSYRARKNPQLDLNAMLVSTIANIHGGHAKFSNPAANCSMIEIVLPLAREPRKSSSSRVESFHLSNRRQKQVA